MLVVKVMKHMAHGTHREPCTDVPTDVLYCLFHPRHVCTAAGSGVVSDPYRLYNLDVFEYDHYSPFGLYGAIPVLVAHKAGYTVGAFW